MSYKYITHTRVGCGGGGETKLGANNPDEAKHKHTHTHTGCRNTWWGSWHTTARVCLYIDIYLNACWGKCQTFILSLNLASEERGQKRGLKQKSSEPCVCVCTERHLSFHLGGSNGTRPSHAANCASGNNERELWALSFCSAAILWRYIILINWIVGRSGCGQIKKWGGLSETLIRPDNANILGGNSPTSI